MNKLFSILALLLMIMYHLIQYSLSGQLPFDISFIYNYTGFIIGLIQISVLITVSINILKFANHTNRIISTLSILGMMLVFGGFFGIIPISWIDDLGIILLIISSFMK